MAMALSSSSASVVWTPTPPAEVLAADATSTPSTNEVVAPPPPLPSQHLRSKGSLSNNGSENCMPLTAAELRQEVQSTNRDVYHLKRTMAEVLRLEGELAALDGVCGRSILLKALIAKALSCPSTAALLDRLEEEERTGAIGLTEWERKLVRAARERFN